MSNKSIKLRGIIKKDSPAGIAGLSYENKITNHGRLGKEA